MKAIVGRDRDAGIGGLSLTDVPYPHAGQNDVIVRVHAAGFTPGELNWPTTWVDLPAVIERPACQDTSCLAWSSSWGTAPQG
jgi:NADPH:quinone reductase-like Zn-dependent oxidoreductase